jgi:hypothetical protein
MLFKKIKNKKINRVLPKSQVNSLDHPIFIWSTIYLILKEI